MATKKHTQMKQKLILLSVHFQRALFYQCKTPLFSKLNCIKNRSHPFDHPSGKYIFIQTAMETRLTSYEKLKGAGGSEGTDYQIKLLELFLLHGYRSGRDFRLSTENKKAGNFDDVVCETDAEIVLLQAKHRGKGAVDFDQLFPDAPKGDFNLYKYAKEFPKIVRHFDVARTKIVLCTNLKFNTYKINTCFSKHVKNDSECLIQHTQIDSFNFIANKECYKFHANREFLSFVRGKVNDKESEGYLEEFFNKLLLITVTDKDVDESISGLIENLKFSPPKSFKEYFFDKVKMWFQADKGVYLTKDNFEQFVIQKRSENYIENLVKGFSMLITEKNGILDKNPFSLDENFLILKLGYRETYDLHMFIIYILLMLENNNYNESQLREISIYVDPEIPENFNRSIELFLLPQYVYLILPIVDLKMLQVLLKYDKLFDFQKQRCYKKLIFLTDKEEVLEEFNRFSPNIKKALITFDHFSRDLQEKILTKEIKFQGNVMSMKSIIHNETHIIGECILQKLLLMKRPEEIVVHDVAPTKNIPYYVERYFIKHEQNIRFSEKEFCYLILEEIGDKTIMILDDPGMGKSIILDHIFQTLLRHPYWVMKINLNECNKFLYHLSKSNRDRIDLDELMALLKITGQTTFETNVFNLAHNVVLLLDALDEVSSEFTNMMINSLEALTTRSNIKKIVVTSRVHVLKNFKDKNLRSDNFALMPFSEDESVQVLSNLWWDVLYEQRDKSKYDDIKKFSLELLNRLSNRTGWHRVSTLIGIPLQTKMIGDIFVKNCKSFVEEISDEISLPEYVNLRWLYDEFVKRKKDIYIEEKGNAAGNEIVMESIKNQFEAAIKEFVKEALILEFPDAQEFFKDVLEAPQNCDEKFLLKMGVLIKIDDDLQFVHKTFSEYFASRYISDLIVGDRFPRGFLQRFFESGFFEYNNFMEDMLEDRIVPGEFKSCFFDWLVKQNWCPNNIDLILLLLPEHGYEELWKLGLVQLLKGMHEEIGTNHTPEFLKILEKVENVHIIDKFDNTPLHFASQYNCVEVVKLLLDKGHPLVVQNSSGATALHVAIQSSCISCDKKFKIVRELLARKHPVAIRDNDGETPLHCAVRKNDINNVRNLLLSEHPPNVRNKKGQTPLHLGIDRGNLNLLTLLLDKGHSIHVEDNEGNTPLQYATRINKENIAEFLLSKK